MQSTYPPSVPTGVSRSSSPPLPKSALPPGPGQPPVKLGSGRPLHIHQTTAYLDLLLRSQTGGKGVGLDEEVTAVTLSLEGELGATSLAAGR